MSGLDEWIARSSDGTTLLNTNGLLREYFPKRSDLKIDHTRR